MIEDAWEEKLPVTLSRQEFVKKYRELEGKYAEQETCRGEVEYRIIRDISIETGKPMHEVSYDVHKWILGGKVNASSHD